MRIKLTRDKPPEEVYSKRNYYWYLHCAEFVRCFLKPIAGCVDLIKAPCLDVGCGEGWLYDYVSVDYHGIDACELGIANAQTLRPHGSFEVGRLESWITDRTFGTVVFGNVLHPYVSSDSYLDVLKRYEDMVCPSQIIVYDFAGLDTSEIEKHYCLTYTTQSTANVPTLEKSKRSRKVMLFTL